MRDTITRLTAVEPVMLDGAPWWPLRAVCDALRCPSYQVAAKLVDPAHKRRWVVRARDWRHKTIVLLIDRGGVEHLVIRHCRDAPRWTVMAALDARARHGEVQQQSHCAACRCGAKQLHCIEERSKRNG